MSLRRETPCDFGSCPYDAQYSSTCEYYCGEEEPEDMPDIDDEYEEDECLIDCLDERAEYPEELDYPKEYWEE